MSPAHRKYYDPTKMSIKDLDLIVDERLMETGYKSWSKAKRKVLNVIAMRKTTGEIGKRERQRKKHRGWLVSVVALYFLL